MKKNRRIKKYNWFFMLFKRMGVIKYIFIIYILITFLISLFLYWPITHTESFRTSIKNNEVTFSYIDALFLAASAFSDTGLTPISIAYSFNMFGQALIAISVLVGGLGIFTLKVYILQTIFGSKINVFNSALTQIERGSADGGKTKKIIKVSVSTLLISLFVFTIIFTFIFYYSPYGKFSDIEAAKSYDLRTFNPYEFNVQNPKGDFGKSLRYAIFHSICSINNAGFDNIGSKSLMPYYEDYSLQIFTLIAAFIGGVGFPVIYDIYKKLNSYRKTQPRYRVTLFTKLTLITYVFVSIIGLLLTFLFETTSKNQFSFWNQSQYGSTFAKSFAVIFQTQTTRSSGFITTDYYNFTQQTLLVHSILMFIGFSSASTAGGIRSTTVAIIFLSVVSMLVGKKQVTAFKRQIGKENLIKAINVFAIGIFLVIIGVLICYSTTNLNANSILPHEKKFDTSHILFVVCSAFGSTGSPMGTIPNFSGYGKVTLIIIMIIGQLGIQQTILIWGRNRKSNEHVKYIYEDVAIG